MSNDHGGREELVRGSGRKPRRALAGAARSWRVLVAILLVLPACAAGRPRPSPRAQVKAPPPPPERPPITVPLEIRPDLPQGGLPALFRPSTMLTGTSDDAKRALLGLPGQLGTVRWGLGRLIDQLRNAGDYPAALKAQIAVIKPFVDKGAQLVVTFEGMPWWLSSRQQTGTAGPYGWAIYKASPARDSAAYEDFVYQTVKMLNVDAGLSPLYEFWNEPNSRSFWVGTRAELFSTYDAFTRGARRADPKAQVGGLAVGSWDSPREDEPKGSPPLLQTFLAHARDAQVPVDFVSWHAYAPGPEDRWEGAWEIRGWLTAAGLPATTPQVVDEWNRWATFPSQADQSRDGLLGAAFVPAALMGMDRAGITAQTICTLQDFNDPPAGQVYAGDFGVLTRKPVLKKASFHAFEMLARLTGSRVGADLPADVTDLEGVGALATAEPGRATVLLYRLTGDPGGALLRMLARDGYHSFRELGITKDQIIAYYTGVAPLPAGAPPASLAAVQAAMAKVRTGWASQVTLQLTVRGWGSSQRYTVYRIDDDHLDPGDAFARAMKRGASPAQALQDAQAMQAFTAVATGTGTAPGISFGRYGVALVVLEAGAR